MTSVAYLPAKNPTREYFSWDSLLNKKILELSGLQASARFTYAVNLLLQAQQIGETVAWIQPESGPLFPPDLHASGVDLQALVVVHVPLSAGVYGIPKAAEILLRSGAFGLVILDLIASAPPSGSVAWLGRLLTLTRQHQSALIILTHKPVTSESVGACASWRIAPYRRQLRDGFYELDLNIIKNKTSAMWPDTNLLCCGPWGLT